MWAKLSSALKSTSTRHDQDDPLSPSQDSHNSTIAPTQSLRRSQSLGRSFRHSFSRSHSRSQAEVLTLLLEENSSDPILPNSPDTGPSSSNHPILPIPKSQHQTTETSPSPPSSPSRRSLFKRITKDSDSLRAPSPSLSFLPKKLRGGLHFGNSSQISLASSTTETRSAVSQHKPQPSQDTIRSFTNIIRRPSLDVLRSAIPEPPRPSIDSPTVDSHRHNSVRSILRDPNTPGSGQNVRFFARDVYKVISPEESMEDNFLSPPSQMHGPDPTSFMDRLNQANETNYMSPAVPRSPPGHKSRPSLNGVFAPLESSPKDQNERDRELNRSSTSGDSSMSSMEFASAPLAPPDFNANGSLELSHPLGLRQISPGLSLDVGSPLLDSAIDLDLSISSEPTGERHLTSTPFKRISAKARGKEKERTESFKVEDLNDDKKEFGVRAPRIVDEAVFRAKERQPAFSPPQHERSQSFSFGQTIYYSTGKASPGNVLSPAYSSSDNVRPLENGASGLSSAITSPPSTKRHRSRALSDTAFQDMLRSSSPILKKSSEAAPEEDIQDEASRDLILYANHSVPDPFNANANTYYTPQTMIPTTPPAGFPRHTRKTSKEENLIYSLQTQLAMQQEICSQFEADLRTKDEMVALLGTKVADLEKQENQRKGALRQWKKKVQELEKALRSLEDEVDSSRRESMERSIMDEASGEALRMLHRQISSLEREKQDWVVKERAMKDEVLALEVLVKEKSNNAVNLQETEGASEEKEAKEDMRNLGVVRIDEEELKKLAEREQKMEEERQAYHTAEMNWEQEKAELVMKLESTHMEKIKVEEQMESLKQEIKAKEEEFDVIKNELEAQWGHTESASEKIEALHRAKKAAEEDAVKFTREKEEAAQERDVLAQRCHELEQRMNGFELDWNESENRRLELESEVHELWDAKEELEKKQEELEKQLSEERGQSEDLDRALHDYEKQVARLQEDRQANSETISQLEEVIHQRDEEIARHSQLIREQESESEALRKEIGKLDLEHSDLVDEHKRALKEAVESEGEARRQLRDLVRQKGEADTEVKTFKDRVESLKNEMDRLRTHIHDLQQESADKEVKIVQLTKQHGQDKEDIQGLNIALDAKQQELELYKRKVAIKSGSTAPTSASAAKVIQRRESSSLFDGTPASTRPPSRATSVTSDAGSSRGEKVAALGKSSRVNVINGTSSVTGSTVKKRTEGSTMGPPPLKRSPVAATPTPAARLAVTSRVKSPTGATATVHRRVVSNAAEKARPRATVMSPTSSEQSEKENLGGEMKSVKRRNMVPVPS